MFSTLKHLYLSEVNDELSKVEGRQPGFITERDLLYLPVPVQRYYRYCGYIGLEKMLSATIEWEKTFLRFLPHSGWKAMECLQFSAVEEPARIVYMKSKLLGFLPFEGKDKYKDGHGNMKMRLFYLLNIADAKGREIDASALITILAEALLVPSYALQPYITWQPVNDITAKATITYNGTRVSGNFFFTETGRFLKFETADRYYSESGKNYKRMKWTAIAKSYKTINRISFPTFFNATWNTPTGDYTYYKGWIKNIAFNGKPNYEADRAFATL